MSYAVRPLEVPAAADGPAAPRWAAPAAKAVFALALLTGAAWCVLLAFRTAMFVDSRLAAGMLYCSEPPASERFTSTCRDHACLEREARILMDRQSAAVKYELRCNQT